MSKRVSPGRGRAMAVAMLLCTAAIWGSTFLFQKEGAEHVGPFAFTAIRGVLGSAFLGIVMLARSVLHNGAAAVPDSAGRRRATLRGGLACGVALGLASMLQQLGVADTTPGVCAFLTGTYVVLVPISGLLLGRRPRSWIWCGVAAAACGLFLICVDPAADSFRIGRGEAFTLACAAAFTLHIMLAERFSSRADVVAMCALQWLFASVFSLPFLALQSERACLNAEALRAAAFALVWAGVVSSGIAYTLQVAAQGSLPSAVAALIMSLESLFALLTQYIFMPGATQTPRQLLGCALMFCAVVGVQVAEAMPQSAARRNQAGT